VGEKEDVFNEIYYILVSKARIYPTIYSLSIIYFRYIHSPLQGKFLWSSWIRNQAINDNELADVK
jgi:hypothetical protein